MATASAGVRPPTTIALAWESTSDQSVPGVDARCTVALQREGLIGWTFRPSVLQRRAGRVTVVATTAGAGAYAVPDAASDDGLALAATTVPGLLTPFLASPEPMPLPA